MQQLPVRFPAVRDTVRQHSVWAVWQFACQLKNAGRAAATASSAQSAAAFSSAAATKPTYAGVWLVWVRHVATTAYGSSQPVPVHLNAARGI
jgi:hypothetical protein